MEKQLTIEDYEICNKLKNMRFSGMAEALEEVFRNPNAELLPFREIINKIVDAEACLARLLNDAYRLEMNGKNMRNIEPINKQS